jgi:DNA-binding transcriptional ArsR family regulator
MAMVDHDPAVDRATGAKLFRGLGDPTRLAILNALAGGERRVTDLVTAVGLSQSTVSAHVACLRDCGLVTDRPQGRATYYRIARPELFGLLSAAEQLLAATGTAIELCPNYQDDCGQARP